MKYFTSLFDILCSTVSWVDSPIIASAPLFKNVGHRGNEWVKFREKRLL